MISDILSLRQEFMISYCMRFTGLPYIWGGDDAIMGFDCSGFAQEFLEAFGGHPRPGMDLSAQGLFDETMISGKRNVESTGALAFYGRSLSNITHVAISLGGGFIFEFGGGGSSETTREEAAEANAYGRIRPIRRRADFLCCVYPKFN